jgi:NAD(P)-dependent dehydrogenase (short-subunit alcohol dehydrogenase family)
MENTKTILVTGAGSGIGRAISQYLSKNAYTLVLLGRNLNNLEETKNSLENSDKHQCISCDIRIKKDVATALANSKIKSLYALVANAGIGGENSYSADDRWHEIIDTNLTGTYNTIHECLPYLKKNKASFKKIVIISSILARLGVPGYSAYCASKAGLLGLNRSLAIELAQDKILVNALCPGWVNTDMAHEGLQAFSDALKISKEEAHTKAMTDVPLGKMSEPDEIAQLTAFLVSGAQTSITGQTLDINNGAMMP